MRNLDRDGVKELWRELTRTEAAILDHVSSKGSTRVGPNIRELWAEISTAKFPRAAMRSFAHFDLDLYNWLGVRNYRAKDYPSFDEVEATPLWIELEKAFLREEPQLRRIVDEMVTRGILRWTSSGSGRIRSTQDEF